MVDPEKTFLEQYRAKFIAGDRTLSDSIHRVEYEPINNLNYDIHLTDVNHFLTGRKSDLEISFEELERLKAEVENEKNTYMEHQKFVGGRLAKILNTYVPIINYYDNLIGKLLIYANYSEIVMVRRGEILGECYRLGSQRKVSEENRKMLYEWMEQAAKMSASIGVPMSPEFLAQLNNMKKTKKQKDLPPQEAMQTEMGKSIMNMREEKQEEEDEHGE